jgi:hypothetical protein
MVEETTVADTTPLEEWSELEKMQLIVYTCVKRFGINNVLEITGTDGIPAPQGRIRFSWMTSPTSIIVHMAEGKALDELDALEAKELKDED